LILRILSWANAGKSVAACNHSTVAYTFRNRFKIGGSRFSIAAYERLLAEPPFDDGRVVLQAGDRDKLISDVDELVLMGSGYPDFDAARDAGRKWRQILIVALPRENKSVDLGDGDDGKPVATEHIYDLTDPPELIANTGVTRGDRLVFDRHGLTVSPTDPPAQYRYVRMGVPSIAIGDGPSIAEVAKGEHVPFDAQQTLAYALVHKALSDANPETRYIQLVTAIEALLPERKRPKEILHALSDLKSVAKDLDWPDDVTTRILQILKKNNEESVHQIAMDLVSQLNGTYDGLDPKGFFELCYENRSALVHGHVERPDVADYGVLLSFVLDVLDIYAQHRVES
jgi:hypothetical protein